MNATLILAITGQDGSYLRRFLLKRLRVHAAMRTCVLFNINRSITSTRKSHTDKPASSCINAI